MKEKIVLVLTEALDLSYEDFDRSQRLLNLAEWDSYNIVTLMSDLYEKFGLTLTLEVLNDFNTLGDIYDWIEMPETVVKDIN